MAKLSKSSPLNGLSGTIDRLVFKKTRHGTVVSKYSHPPKRKKRPSEFQKMKQGRFAEAVKYAQGIIRDPQKKKAYEKKVKRNQTVYHFAIREYMKKNRMKEPEKFLTGRSR